MGIDQLRAAERMYAELSRLCGKSAATLERLEASRGRAGGCADPAGRILELLKACEELEADAQRCQDSLSELGDVIPGMTGHGVVVQMIRDLARRISDLLREVREHDSEDEAWKEK